MIIHPKKIMKKSSLQFHYLLAAVCLLFVAASSKASANNIFSGTTTNNVNTTFDYIPGEGGEGGSGGITDTVYLDVQPTVRNLATSSLLTFQFIAPTGTYFNFDANKYSGQTSLNLSTELFGLTSAPSLLGASISFINPTGDLLPSYNSSSSITLVPVYGKTRFTSYGLFPSGVGTFDGIEFNFILSGISTVPVTWAGNGSTDINNLVKPQFTASANTPVDNGAILSIVPEPSALSPFAVGLVGLAVIGRRRKTRRVDTFVWSIFFL